MRRIRVALVASDDAPFVRLDQTLLAEAFDVRRASWRGKRSIPGLAWAILRSDVVFSWFALDHAYVACRFAHLFRRKSVVVVGGGDAARIPELAYGAHLNGSPMASRSRYALANSDRVLVVDDSLREQIASNAGVPRADIENVPTGYDTTYFSPDGRSRTNVLTVGAVTDVNLRRKGLITFVQAARLVPDLPFVLVGMGVNEASERLRAMTSSNLRLMPHVDEHTLREEYRRARVYVQASLFEGLPNALAEAMASGCVPVGTRVAGIPTLIGETGYFVPPEDPGALAAAIRTAYAHGDGRTARDRIQEHFPLARRRDSLQRILTNLVREERET
jgi:glycosyltransferase involved in cell wall biosynthesis